jgi:integrative and conjugative element protein (TIGR02256 family)
MDPIAKKVKVIIPRAALEAVYDECDGFDADETGGRLIGTYKTGLMGGLTITVTGIIEPGPNAKRSQTSFFQDGEYQEKVFRQVESLHPETEHLGNWHTHHVNGYPTLSGGDRKTYHRIVNHKNHNTDFFYALLVTAQNNPGHSERYAVRHFLVFRDMPGEFEIHPSNVKVVNTPIAWPTSATTVEPHLPAYEVASASQDQRAQDSEFFKRFQPGLRAFMGKANGRVHWRGKLSLVDDSAPEILVAELDGDEPIDYGIVLKGAPPALMDVANQFSEQKFGSAREAVLRLERELNRAVYRSHVSRPQ